MVAGRNFGTDSSREHAVIALQAAGIRAIVVESAARIFFRNAINLGMPVMISAAASRGLEAGQLATVNVARHAVEQGKQIWTAQPLGGEVAAILASGGLMQRTRQLLAAGPMHTSETFSNG
jgi:3-isopropylmalate/(R)-2-methylmalate dehydratase small subunit